MVIHAPCIHISLLTQTTRKRRPRRDLLHREAQEPVQRGQAAAGDGWLEGEGVDVRGSCVFIRVIGGRLHGVLLQRHIPDEGERLDVDETRDVVIERIRMATF